MKIILERIMPVLGLSICILSAQIPAYSWTTHIPFYYFVPHSPHPTNNIAVGPSFALESPSPIIEKLEMTYLHRELSQIRIAIAQLTTKSDLNQAIKSAVEKILSNLQMTTTEFATKLDLDDIKTKLNQTSSAVEATNIELSANKLDLDDIKTKLAQTSSAVEATNIELSANKLDLDDIKTKLAQTSSAVEVTKIKLSATNLHLDNMTTTVGGIYSNLLKLTQAFENETALVDIGHMPTSCMDLQSIGYKMNGIFQIKGPKQIESVYCDFTTNATDLQKWIGYADVKSSPVYFYAETSSFSNETGSPILFDLVPLNVGNSMNLTSGIFTAPRPGSYFFSFTGLSSYYIEKSQLLISRRVGLYLNGVRMGKGGDAGVQDTDDNLWSPLTLNLKSGDQVWMENSDHNATFAYSFDSLFNYYHFTGFMLEEDIVASL